MFFSKCTCFLSKKNVLYRCKETINEQGYDNKTEEGPGLYD